MPTVIELEAPADVHTPVELPAGILPIATFLAAHPGMLEVVNEGIQHLHQVFPETSGFRLALKADPDIADWTYLVVSVKTASPVAEAHARLKKFVETWWLAHSAQCGDVLLFNVEYL